MIKGNRSGNILMPKAVYETGAEKIRRTIAAVSEDRSQGEHVRLLS
jgi:hypothetical protein